MLRLVLLSLLLLAPCGLLSAEPLPSHWAKQLEALAEQAAQAGLPPGGRAEVQIGAPDPRLRLAPCAQVQPFLPTGQPAYGRGRLGLRCLQRTTRWSISVPMTVRVFAPAWAAVGALPAGTVLQSDHLRLETVEWSAETSPVLAQPVPPLGRQLQRPLQAGEALRQAHLKPRQWFAAGDPVRLLLQGEGFAVRGEGQALAPGLEGRSAKVRLESGRVLSVWPVGERLAEVAL